MYQGDRIILTFKDQKSTLVAYIKSKKYTLLKHILKKTKKVHSPKTLSSDQCDSQGAESDFFVHSWCFPRAKGNFPLRFFLTYSSRITLILFNVEVKPGGRLVLVFLCQNHQH